MLKLDSKILNTVIPQAIPGRLPCAGSREVVRRQRRLRYEPCFGGGALSPEAQGRQQQKLTHTTQLSGNIHTHTHTHAQQTEKHAEELDTSGVVKKVSPTG